jgi:5-formyltetrahydrofolate cyclo-ligase
LIPYEIPAEGSLSDYLITSAYGIAEPDPNLCREADPEFIDLIIIPGSVFDQYENRMGYGKGCYDRFLAELPQKAFKLALAYDFQVLPCIPADPTDVKMDKILTISTVNI